MLRICLFIAGTWKSEIVLIDGLEYWETRDTCQKNMINMVLEIFTNEKEKRNKYLANRENNWGLFTLMIVAENQVQENHTQYQLLYLQTRKSVSKDF